MKIGVLGSGTVAQTIADKLLSLGHDVTLGTRDAAKLAAWKKKAGGKAKVGSFAEAAVFGELLFNCTAGSASLSALKLAEEKNINGKIVIDVSNPLDFSKGMPPFSAYRTQIQ